MPVICSNARGCVYNMYCGHRTIHTYNETICHHACTEDEYLFGDSYMCIEVKHVT